MKLFMKSLIEGRSMANPLLNEIIKRKNDLKTWAVIGAVLFVLLMILIGVVVSKHHQRDKSVSQKTASAHIEPFEQIVEFNQSATGEAIGNLQTSENSTTSRVSQLESENQKLTTQNKQFSDQLSNMSKVISGLQKKVDSTDKQSVQGIKANGNNPQVVNMNNPVPSNMEALGNPESLAQSNANMTASGIADFNFHYQSESVDQASQDCTPNNCVLPGTFAKAVLLGAADANASVNGQSNTTPILFKILNGGTLPNGYHTHLKGCFVVGEVYGDISSERGEVKLAQISCVLDGQTVTKSINGTAYFLGKEGIRGTPVMRNGQLLWNAGVAGMLNGLAQGVQQAATTQSISPLGQTSTVSSDKIEMAMGAGGVQSAANTLANYYVKRADQYHPIIELNAGTLVNLVFLNKFLLTAKDESNGAVVTKHQSNRYWNTDSFNSAHSANSSDDDSNDKDNLSSYNYDDVVSDHHINAVSQQIKALGASNS